ncbi:MAG: hypothetical protein QM811_31410 [Pirellulales bacterium]
MPEIAFATYALVPEIGPDDRLLAQALTERGVRAVPCVWNDPSVDWTRFDATLIRSTWDYHEHADAFLAWVRSFETSRTRLWNTPSLVERNLHKFYLRDLQTSGAEIIPTEFISRGSNLELSDILRRNDWREAVVKPAISAGSIGTWRTSGGPGDDARFREQLATADLLVQPFMSEIVNAGEWSLVFFESRFSHAVIKRPAPADFRVQSQFGGEAIPIVPPGWLMERAASILGQYRPTPLYARIDGIVASDRFLLMEVELIEPYLFLGTSPDAASRFAGDILKRL